MSDRTYSQDELEGEVAKVGQHWPWILITAIAYVVLGAIALSMPAATTLGLILTIAALLIAAGIIQFVQAVGLRHRKGSVTRFFQSILSLIAGGLMFRYPEGGMLSIALVLSFYFFISATTQWILTTALPQQSTRIWGYIGSFCSFFLGLYIIFTFPFSALWVPGLLLAVDLLVSGGALVGFSFSVRNFYKNSIIKNIKQSKMSVVPSSSSPPLQSNKAR